MSRNRYRGSDPRRLSNLFEDLFGPLTPGLHRTRRPLAQKIDVQRLRCLWWTTICGIAESAKANLAPFGWHSSLLTLAKLRL
jgi:hypothetical protein